MDSFVGIGFAVALVGAWATHILTCLYAAAWGLLIAGALFPPIGIFHGIAVWLGSPFV